VNAITPFEFEDQLVRIVEISGEPWFVAKDVCAVLEIKNTTQAVQSLDDDEYAMFNIGYSEDKGCPVVVDTPSRGNPNRVIVSESGMYALVFKSRKPAARRFRKWVTSEVLPSIRKTGSYEATPIGLGPSHLPVDAGVWLSLIREARFLKGTYAAQAMWDASPLPALPDAPDVEADVRQERLKGLLRNPPVPAMTLEQIVDHLGAVPKSCVLAFLRQHNIENRRVHVGGRGGAHRRVWVLKAGVANCDILAGQMAYDPPCGAAWKGAA